MNENEKELTDACKNGDITVLPGSGYDKKKHMCELQTISNQFKDAGVDLVFTTDPKKSDLKNASLLTNNR